MRRPVVPLLLAALPMAGRLGRRVPQGGCAASPPTGLTARAAPSAALLGPSAPALTSTRPLFRLCAENEALEWPSTADVAADFMAAINPAKALEMEKEN